MKLYELKKGDRFEFLSRHIGKVFEMTEKTMHTLEYTDVATKEARHTSSNRKTFRMDIILVDGEELTFTREEFDLLQEILIDAHKECCEQGDAMQHSRGADIDRLFVKFRRLENRIVK